MSFSSLGGTVSAASTLGYRLRSGGTVMTRRLLVLLALTVAVGSSVAYAASLNVSSWHLWAGSQTLTKATCTVTGALVDTYVDQNNAAASFGAAATLGLIPSGNAGKQQWTFVKFDLSSCAIPATGGADSATLSLYLSNAPTTVSPTTSRA